MADTFVQTVARNSKGQDYFVGDLHGNLEILNYALDSVNFDPAHDRLFCAGDLVDRGKYELEIIELLQRDWFFSTLGNHEQLIFNRFDLPEEDLHNPRNTRGFAIKLHNANGGMWFDVLKELERRQIYQMLKQLPYAMTVETEFGNIGVVHAEVPDDFSDWNDFFDTASKHQDVRFEAIWNRNAIAEIYDVTRHSLKSNFSESSPRRINNVLATIHGHTSVHQVIQWGNQFWLDTGYISGRLSIISAQQIAQKIQSAI